MPKLDRAGRFRANIEEYAFQDAKNSPAVSIACKFRITQMYYEGEWHDWPYDQEVYGQQWLIGKDGTFLQEAHEKFMEATGWDGEAESIENKTFKPWPVQITVEEEEYNGKTSYKVAWINHYEDTGGGGGLRSADSSKLATLKSKFGAQFKASAANFKSKKAPTPPSAPPPKSAPPASAQAPVSDSDEIPF